MTSAANPKSVLLIDDDELSRALLNLLLIDAGYEVADADSGESALTHLQQPSNAPAVILTDLQMPGLSGSELARELRAACTPATRLLAMSGSHPADALLRDFDAFLLKPFSMEEFTTALESPTTPTPEPPQAPAEAAAPIHSLDETIYNQLAAMMPSPQLHQLYTMCLNDVETRLARMHHAAARGDSDECRREAHAIKGGSGMIGASEIQSLAAALERHPPGTANHVVSLDEIMLACERLRRILVTREDWAKQ